MAAACLRRLHRIPHPVLKLAAATHWPLPFPGAKLAPVTQSCPSADRVEVQLSARCPAFFLGLSNGSAFAQEDSVSPAAASEHAEGNAPGLQPIEDGSVVSNEHTVKWRIYTDNAREFFQKASNTLSLAWFQTTFGICDRQLDEAEKLFQAALLEAKEGFGLRDPHVASALNNLAEFYRLKKEHVKAEPLYLEAIEILEESFGPDDIRYITNFNFFCAIM
ncbi:Tetratricopeptide repeat (TPR)-like superfamily protein [Zea mays]|uniref:Tetratricopeptide repeat (TPR)-like superfamily protein n=1 Tax=Zea mays TaxID=4577 RepID=A0A1D6GNR8_MAIZE|nr:Tetratricopeptide repeat (TPR)-like superfamily protein [Zea mays]